MSEYLKNELKLNMQRLMIARQSCKYRIKNFGYDSDRQEITIVEMMIENQINFTKSIKF